MDAIAQQTLEALEGAEGEELSIVELVVAACEFSEDQGEIADLVDGLVWVQSGCQDLRRRRGLLGAGP